jgi:methylglyoxal/glyoxal reductase
MTSLRLNSTIKLNDGLSIPRLGLGVYLTQSADAIKHALQFGYRHIDTAQWYENEHVVGEGFKASGLKREDVWITTKVS